MKFDFSKYQGKYVMHCKTEEEAKDFCRVMHEDGRKWRTEEPYLDCEEWDYYKDKIAYFFNSGTVSSLDWEGLEVYTILEWEDFMEKEFTKADLKDGMVGVTRDGQKFVWMCGKFRHQNGTSYYELDSLTEDFKSFNPHFKSIDFMQICTSSAEILNEWFNDEYLTPVWQRPEEITEMTVSEIKEALGIAGTLKIKEG